MRPNWEQDLRKLERLLPSLPCFVTKYVDHKLPDLSPSSLLMYGRDYKQFLEWLIVERLPSCSTIKEVTLQHLEQLYMEDIDAFKAYLRVRKNNSTVTRERKIAALKSLFHYLSQVAEDEQHYPLLKRNVMAKVQLKSRRVINASSSALEGKILETDNEIESFIHFIQYDYGKMIAENKQALYYYRQNRIRDVCIVSLILASGLRVSEVVHLNLNDIDLLKKIAYVYRKGYAYERTKQGVYFTESGRQNLQSYLKIREDVYKPARSVKALFLAIPRGKKSGKQMSKRAIQAMVLKYAQVFGKPHLSVHKLRHSFATSYYLRNDIYKTARQLGHVSTDSTQIYAHLSDRTMSKAIDSKG